MRWGLESNASLSPDMASLTDQLVSLATFCAFIAGLGRALLMLPRPSWRLPAIPDRIASALGPFPAILAVALMLVATEERINSVTGTSLALTVALNGLTALVTALIFATALLRYHHVRRKHDLERPGGIAGLIPFVASVWIAAILLALFTGYLSLAYFLTGKLLWISVIAATTYLLIAFFGDICETLLSPKHPSGLALANALGLSPRHQAQASTVLAGVGRTLLLLTALLLAFLPVGSSPSELLQGFAQLGESSKTLGNLNIVPQDILVALLLFVGGLFALRIVKRWLSERLLPETNMDAGMRASLVTLVGYLGFVLLAMLVMSTLRINLTSLTWVVSAPLGRHRLRPAGHRAELHFRPDPADRAAGEGRRLGQPGRGRGRYPADQRARHRDPDGRPLHGDRAELAVHLPDRAQRDHGQCPRGGRGEPDPAAGHRRDEGPRTAPAGLRRTPGDPRRTGALGDVQGSRQQRPGAQRQRLRQQPAFGGRRAQRPALHHPRPLAQRGIALSSPQSLLMIQDGGPASAAPAPATPD